MPSVESPAIPPNTTLKRTLVKSGLRSTHAGPRMVCLYSTAKLRLTNRTIRSRYRHSSCRSMSNQPVRGRMIVVHSPLEALVCSCSAIDSLPVLSQKFIYTPIVPWMAVNYKSRAVCGRGRRALPCMVCSREKLPVYGKKQYGIPPCGDNPAKTPKLPQRVFCCRNLLRKRAGKESVTVRPANETGAPAWRGLPVLHMVDRENAGFSAGC